MSEARFSAMDRVVYRGHDDLRRLQRTVTVDQRVAALFELSATGKGSDVQLAEKPGVVFTLEAGEIVQIDAYPTQAEALDAVGASP